MAKNGDLWDQYKVQVASGTTVGVIALVVSSQTVKNAVDSVTTTNVLLAVASVALIAASLVVVVFSYRSYRGSVAERDEARTRLEETRAKLVKDQAVPIQRRPVGPPPDVHTVLRHIQESQADDVATALRMELRSAYSIRDRLAETMDDLARLTLPRADEQEVERWEQRVSTILVAHRRFDLEARFLANTPEETDLTRTYVAMTQPLRRRLDQRTTTLAKIIDELHP